MSMSGSCSLVIVIGVVIVIVVVIFWMMMMGWKVGGIFVSHCRGYIVVLR